jgi:hypothetical protein
MASIKLYFSDFPKPELFRIVFESPHSGNKTAVRGKTTGASRAGGTFQWTAAVRALCALLLKNLASGCLGSESIQGGKGSLAASLDYALSKEPEWLLDVFGFDANSKAVSRRLFLRSNPDGQRDGPRQITLSPHQWSSVSVFMGDKQTKVISPRSLNQMIAAIAADDALKEISWEARFREVFFQEVRARLSNSYIFNPAKRKALIQGLLDNPSFKKLGGDESMLVSEIDQRFDAASQLGLDSEGLNFDGILTGGPPIKALVPHTCAAALSLFWYLKSRGCSIEINFFQPHTVDISKRLIANSYNELPDVCVLAVPPAVALLSAAPGADYSPLMLLPALSQRIVAPKRDENSLETSKEFLFVGDLPSMSTFLHDDLLRRRIISKKGSKVFHMEADQVISSLKEPNPFSRAILFFPHFHFNHWHNDSAFLEIDGKIEDEHPSLLYAHSSFLADKEKAKALNISLRNAWLTMLEQPDVFESVLDDLLFNSQYLTAARRFGGLHNL